MKKLLLCMMACCMALLLAAQKRHPQADTFYVKRPLIPEGKQKLLSNIDVIANMQHAFRNEFTDGKHIASNFAVNQFRLEIKGKIHDRVFFRFRDRYTKKTDPQSIDNLSSSTDMAYIQVKATDQWSFTAGKLSADWGGIEFDLNPIDIYEYSDILNYSDNFLAGAGAQYQMNERHQFSIQVLNSRTRSFREIYGEVPGITEAKFPFALVGNWRGSLLKGKLNTIWSYSIFKEANRTYMHYLALGNQLVLHKFQLAYDFKYSKEDLDRKTILSGIIPDSGGIHIAARNVVYASHWVKADYRISNRINLSIVGMLDQANWKGNRDPQKDKKIRTAWGYIPTLEYFPFKDLNLKFYANYVGRVYRFSSYAKQQLGAVNYNTGLISIGFSSPLYIL